MCAGTRSFLLVAANITVSWLHVLTAPTDTGEFVGSISSKFLFRETVFAFPTIGMFAGLAFLTADPHSSTDSETFAKVSQAVSYVLFFFNRITPQQLEWTMAHQLNEKK